jgi:hypothetical protein
MRLRDLPVHLQRKYKNSVLFEKESTKEGKLEFSLQRLRERRAEKEKTIE